MPKIVMSIDLISADAEATSNKTDKNAMAFFISSPSVNAGTEGN
jgi:hypothetical protein